MTMTMMLMSLFLALVSVSEEVRSRCHLKHRFCTHISESVSSDSISNELISHHPYPPPSATSPQQHPQPSAAPYINLPLSAVAPAGQLPSLSTGHGTGSISPTWSSAGTAAAAGAGMAEGTGTGGLSPQGVCSAGGPPVPARRQKSCDALDASALAQARIQKNSQLTQLQVRCLCYCCCSYETVISEGRKVL